MSIPLIHHLSNGVRIVMENVPGRRSVSSSITLSQGSRHETAEQNGMTHFCEHLVFKGTEQLHWKDISQRINQLGGQFNASTSTDNLKLYAMVIENDLGETLSLLSEMLLNSTFPDQEVVRERQVILEEIAMYDDMPEDLCFEHFSQALLLPHPIGRPVIGDTELVEGFQTQALRDYWQKSLAPERILISLAGSFDIDQTIAHCEKLFGGLSTKPSPQGGLDPLTGNSKKVILERDLEQVNFCFGVTGPTKRCEDRFAWVVYDAILGGGMGSRLFDEVREKKGLAYSIGSSLSTMHEAGYLMVSGSTRPEFAEAAIEICHHEINDLAQNGPKDEELETIKAQLARTHILSTESLNVRCSANGDRELYGLPHMTEEEVAEKLRKVSKDDITQIAQKVTAFGTPAMCLVGPVEEEKG